MYIWNVVEEISSEMGYFYYLQKNQFRKLAILKSFWGNNGQNFILQKSQIYQNYKQILVRAHNTAI